MDEIKKKEEEPLHEVWMRINERQESVAAVVLRSKRERRTANKVMGAVFAVYVFGWWFHWLWFLAMAGFVELIIVAEMNIRRLNKAGEDVAYVKGALDVLKAVKDHFVEDPGKAEDGTKPAKPDAIA